MFIEPGLPLINPRPFRSEISVALGFMSLRKRTNPVANTFSQIYIQTVFAVSSRESLIKPEFKEDLYKYITGIIRNQGQKLISINDMPDHVHILIGLKPSMPLAEHVREIKADSTNFVNKNKL